MIRSGHLEAVIVADEQLHRRTATGKDVAVFRRWTVAVVAATLARSVATVQLCQLRPYPLAYACADLFMATNGYRLALEPAVMVGAVMDMQTRRSRLTLAALLFQYAQPWSPLPDPGPVTRPGSRSQPRPWRRS